MSSQSEGDLCAFCKQGHVITRDEEVAFHQRTDKGYVFCRVSIRMGVCDHCGSRSADDSADAIMDEAVRREYDKLP